MMALLIIGALVAATCIILLMQWWAHRHIHIEREYDDVSFWS